MTADILALVAAMPMPEPTQTTKYAGYGRVEHLITGPVYSDETLRAERIKAAELVLAQVQQTDLHAQIMNLRTPAEWELLPDEERIGLKMAHKLARHAAIELVLTAQTKPCPHIRSSGAADHAVNWCSLNPQPVNAEMLAALKSARKALAAIGQQDNDNWPTFRAVCAAIASAEAATKATK